MANDACVARFGSLAVRTMPAGSDTVHAAVPKLAPTGADASTRHEDSDDAATVTDLIVIKLARRLSFTSSFDGRSIAAEQHALEPSMTHITVALIPSKAGQADALGQALRALVEPSRKEDGCLGYDIFRSKDDPDLWMAFEEWRSPEHLAAHFEQPHMLAFVGRMPDLVNGDLDLQGFSRA